LRAWRIRRRTFFEAALGRRVRLVVARARDDPPRRVPLQEVPDLGRGQRDAPPRGDPCPELLEHQLRFGVHPGHGGRLLRDGELGRLAVAARAPRQAVETMIARQGDPLADCLGADTE
jgi:hypothetical protein